MSVLAAAWVGVGAPVSQAASGGGVCARCSASTRELVAVAAVVSRSFTGYDRWADPTGRGLCGACTWGYSTTALRALPHLVRRNPAELSLCSRAQVVEVLKAGSLAAGVALVVPLRPGRKHLLPDAVWGRVAVDDAHLSWSGADADRLAVVQRLRRLGFGSRMLTAPAPPFALLERLPRAQWSEVMAAWARLELWRTAVSPWLSLALHVTVPTTRETTWQS